MSQEIIPLISGHYYHIYNRGNNGENLFVEERNYPYFLQLYARHIFPIADTYAYCLMKNHFHLLVRPRQKDLTGLNSRPDLTGLEDLSGLSSGPNLTGLKDLSGLGSSSKPNLTGLKDLSGFDSSSKPNLTGLEDLSGLGSSSKPNLTGLKDLSGFDSSSKPNLTGLEDLSGFNYSKSFSDFFNAYTKTINKTYHRTGSLFEKPFKRLLVDSDSYLVHLVSYIHRNPQKHGFTNDFRTYPHSSYYTIQQQKRSRLESQQVLEWFDNLQSFENYHWQSDELVIRHLIEEDDFY
jgi:REP element-mobilizing transposase RayT